MISPTKIKAIPVPSLPNAVMTIPPDTKAIFLSDEEPVKGTYATHSKIGRLNKMGEQDIFDVLNTLTKGELNIFTLLKTRLDYKTNEITLTRAFLSKKEKRQLSTSFKALYNKKLVKRVAQNQYMLSPYYILPTALESPLETIRAKWDNLP